VGSFRRRTAFDAGCEAVAAIKELATPADVRVIMAYEEAHKNRHDVVSADHARVAAIAKRS
jgi:hypothetical protein